MPEGPASSRHNLSGIRDLRVQSWVYAIIHHSQFVRICAQNACFFGPARPRGLSLALSVTALARRFGVDQAVAYAVAAKAWQLIAGQLTALAIVFCLTKTEQGYYYAFLYLLAMQIFVELGLHVVLINVSSHEWSQLRHENSEIQGDSTAKARLSALTRTSTKWYSIAAILFTVLVGVSGLIYFSPADFVKDATHTVAWTAPWLCLVVLTGLQLCILPKTAILEGCGQLPTINRIRFWQAIAGSAVVWTIMVSGGAIWALCGSALVRLIGEYYLVATKYRGFFQSLEEVTDERAIDWKLEVVPLQWRIAVQGVLYWFASHLAGLVLFKVHGEATGGRFGLMWTVLTAVQSASMAWVETRRPLFGQLIAEKNYTELDRQFFRMSQISMALVLAGATLVVSGVYVVNEFDLPYFDHIADRLPTPLATLTFAVAFVSYQPALCTNLYVRAHKRDPFLIPAIVSSLSIATLVSVLGWHYSIQGAGIGYLIGVGAIQSPIWVTVWLVTRRRWHQQGGAA